MTRLGRLPTFVYIAVAVAASVGLIAFSVSGVVM